MTTDQFFGKWDGKLCDWDLAYGGQCVDVYRQFCHEVLDIPQSPPVVGASDIWNTYLQDRLERIENAPNNCPIKGDIVIWNRNAGGGYGHIAICKDGTPVEFTSFEENWPVGTLCHFQKHNYTNVLGWLRVKPVTESTTITTTSTTSTTTTTVTTQPPITCPPDLSGEVEALEKQLIAAHDIIWGKGWVWIRMNQLKVLLPK